MSNAESQSKVWRPPGFDGVELEKIVGFQRKSPLIYVENYEFSLNMSERKSSGYMIYNGHRDSLGNDFSRPVLHSQSPDTTAIAMLEYDPSPMHMWTLKLSPTAMLQHLREATRKPVVLPHFAHFLLSVAENDHLSSLVRRTIQCFDTPSSKLERETRLLKVALTATNFYTTQRAIEIQVGSERTAAQLVKEYLVEHLYEDVGLDQLALLTGLSRFQVLRAFQREFFTTPHRFQTGLRVSRSKHLLQQGISIAQVSSKLGFYDQAHFSKVFKHFTHVSPSRFVREVGPENQKAGNT